MSLGVKVFLADTFLILAGIGPSLRWVVDQAIPAPIIAIVLFRSFTRPGVRDWLDEP
ncbi:MAG: hypothetical protein WCH74_13035 [Chloroflexota bacterium]